MTNSADAVNWCQKLGLVPRKDGGWARRVHTHEYEVATAFGPRAAACSSHTLLDASEPRIRFHRVRATMLYFLQSGGPVSYALVNGEGWLTEVTLGYQPGQSIMLEVPAGTWRAARLLDSASHALVSEVVIPAIDRGDTEYLTASKLDTGVAGDLRERGWLCA